MANILIRADSSSLIGLGHIMRCLVLAKQFNQDKIIFASQNLEGNINHHILECKHKLEILKSNNIDELSSIITNHKINTIIIDSYNIDNDFETELKNTHKNLKIIAIDDNYKKHNCDILLNHNIGANPNKYKNKVPKHCEILCGEKYTLIRDEFKIEKNKKRIFISLGGSDYGKLNIKILEILETIETIEINIVTTTANQDIEKLKKYCENKNKIILHINTNKIAKLISISHLAIITASVILNEVYFMETPFIAIKTADNQRDLCDYILGLNSSNMLIMKEFNEIDFRQLVKSLI